MRAAFSSLRRDEWLTLTAAAAALAGGLTILGLLIVPDGLVGNLLSEAVGLAVSVIVALTLLERVLARQREREWAIVRDWTTRAIKRRLLDIALAYHLYAGDLPLDEDRFLRDLGVGRSESNNVAALKALSSAMRRIHPHESAGKEVGDPPGGSTPEALHKEVANDFAYIKTALIPRVLTLASDPVLAELLVRLEAHEEDWGAWIRIAEDWGAPDSIAWHQATCAIEVAALIFERIVDDYPSDPPLAAWS